MTKMNELRAKFLNYYRERGHAVIPSSPLVPENDSSTLFTSSGMQPLVPYLLGEKHPAGKRLTDSQKSFRAVDIEEVGDARHTTFFEMLGNWSLGDYFKEEQLPWIFNFLVDEVGLDPAKLYVTVFAGDEKLKIPRDDAAIAIWQKLFAERGINAKIGERIFLYDQKKNWWSRSGEPAQMPAGEPGGPDSEIFYDFGTQLQCHEKSQWKNKQCHPNCDCGRFVEIANSVFMQYQKQADGSFATLQQKNVDYGGGLERLLMAVENKNDVFTTSAFAPLIEILLAETKLSYSAANPLEKKSIRIVADHIRAAVMLMSDGVLPSNKEQGYILRRLLRRAILMADKLQLGDAWLSAAADFLSQQYAEVYPQVKTQNELIKAELEKEAKKFKSTLRNGLKELNKLTEIDGQKAFFLYESCGFPFELTQEIAAQRGLKVDEQAFLQAKMQHQALSKSQSEAKFKGGLADAQAITVQFHTATHLLLAALRKFVKADAYQKGSNITAERARLDFTLDAPLTSEQKQQVEDQINAWIKADLPVKKTMHNKEEALKMVGGSVFADRYPDQVSVYTIEGASQEICVGPHVEHTGEIGPVKIAKEKSVSAGVRRLYLLKAAA
ncbi:MAG: alanine--tRNA ligase [bacterium]|nr:alanine--tRNA ligase [bacterium]